MKGVWRMDKTVPKFDLSPKDIRIRNILNKEFLENVVYTVLINDKVLEKLNNYDFEILEKLYIEKV